MLEAGERLGGYEVVARLRAGGMATLYLARKLGAAGFARPVAVKVIHPHLAQSAAFVQMFVDEAMLSARIDHPNVVHVHELGQARGTYFLAMEYVYGCSLHQVVRALAKHKRRLAPELAVHLAMEAAAGLHAAHETRGDDGELLGVVHRDVSPQNLLIAYAGHLKVIDFGIAKARNSSQQTTTGSLRGKISYMPPEQAYGRRVDRRADVYALGIVLWELLTMRKLFKGENDFALLEMVRSPIITPPSELEPDVPAAVERVVMDALSVDPDQRPATAQELRRRLADALPGARRLESADVAGLLAVVMDEHIRADRAVMPENAARLIQRAEAAPAAPVEPSEVLGTMTLPATRVLLDDENRDDATASAPGPFSPAPDARGPSRGATRALVALAGGVVAIAVTAGFVLGGASQRGAGRVHASAPVPRVATVSAPVAIAPAADVRVSDGGDAPRAPADVAVAPSTAAHRIATTARREPRGASEAHATHAHTAPASAPPPPSAPASTVRQIGHTPMITQTPF